MRVKNFLSRSIRQRLLKKEAMTRSCFHVTREVQLCFRHFIKCLSDESSLTRTRDWVSWRTPRSRTCSSDPGLPRHLERVLINCVNCICLNLQRQWSVALKLASPALISFRLSLFKWWSMLQWALCSLKCKSSLGFRLCGVRELYCTRFGSNLQLACCSSSLSRVWSPTADNRRSLALLYPSHELHGSQLLPGSSESDLWLYTQILPHSQFSPLWTVCAQALNTPQLHCARCLVFFFLAVLKLLPVIEIVQLGVYSSLANFLETKWRALIREDVHIDMNHKM